VITPSFNYVADHQAIRMAGAEPVLCDIREQDLGIDCEKAAELIGPKTKGIMPLHFAGIPCDLEGVYLLAEQKGLRVVEDCCHAFGTVHDGAKIGSRGDIACFSFDPVKIITSIDGGCVITPREDELVRLQRLRLLGVDKDTTERYKNRRAWDYDVLGPGYRYHLTNIMASVGVSQVKRVDEFIASRVRVCKAYNDAFGGLPWAELPPTDFEGISPWIYSLRVPGKSRDDFVAHMRDKFVDVGIHFVPVHKHTYFADCRRSDMSVTDRITPRVVTLPLHSHMKPEYVERVIEAVTSFDPV
jgi:dTDP-4-amino-4,6-dideoxygalactose transaminase